MSTEHDSDTGARLNSTEIRILGSLIEKQATNPETYPLTLNALVLACNQKTSREPVMNLTLSLIHISEPTRPRLYPFGHGQSR